MALLCVDVGAINKAILAIRKHPYPMAKIELLINLNALEEAAEETIILKRKDPKLA
jgi:hypothetical protein